MPQIPASTSPSVALTIAGSDNSAGAGIQADLKTFTSFGVYGLTAVTAVVAEIPGQVKSVTPMPLEVIADQIELCLSAFPVGAIKTGMLWSLEIITCVHEILSGAEKRSRALVVDPVMVASSGTRLLNEAAIAAYGDLLFPLATLVTPNLDEAQVLIGEKIESLDALAAAGKQLAGQYQTAFLMKGGHLRQATAVDLLVTREGVIESFEAPFDPTVSTHGTGCTFSAAITAQLASGESLPHAVGRAKRFITQAIGTSFRWGGTQALNQTATV